MKQKAFTLIETVVYIGLFSFMLSGLFQSAFSLMQSTTTESTNIEINEEVSFVEHKLDWMFSDISKVQSPTGPSASSVLKILKYDIALNPVVVSLQNGILMISRNGQVAVSLTTANVHVDQVSFLYIAPDPTSLRKEGIQSVITINGKTATSTYYVQ